MLVLTILSLRIFLLLLGEIFDFAKYVDSFVCMFVCLFVCLYVCDRSRGHIFQAISFKFFWLVGIFNSKWPFNFGGDPCMGLWWKKSLKSQKSLSLIMGQFSKIHNFVNTWPIMFKFEWHMAGINPYKLTRNRWHPPLLTASAAPFVYNGKAHLKFSIVNNFASIQQIYFRIGIYM